MKLNPMVRGFVFMKIGIIGTGGIASAVVNGFCREKAEHKFYLSPRNKEKAAALASKFLNCTVCTSNQEVLDKSEWIFICLHKKDFAALDELAFRDDHKVVNMSAEMRLPHLKEIINETELLAHVIPLPFITLGIGPVLVYPEIKEVGELFKQVGDVHFANNQDDVHTLQIVTGLMSSYYMLLNEISRFSCERGIEHEESVKFICSLFTAQNLRPTLDNNFDLVELAHDMTPGGYNEQAMNELVKNGAIGAWRAALDAMLERLKNSGKQ